MFSDQVADHLVKYDEQFGDENPMNNMSNFIANLSLNDQADSKLLVYGLRPSHTTHKTAKIYLNKLVVTTVSHM